MLQFFMVFFDSFSNNIPIYQCSTRKNLTKNLHNFTKLAEISKIKINNSNIQRKTEKKSHFIELFYKFCNNLKSDAQNLMTLTFTEKKTYGNFDIMLVKSKGFKILDEIPIELHKKIFSIFFLLDIDLNKDVEILFQKKSSHYVLMMVKSGTQAIYNYSLKREYLFFPNNYEKIENYILLFLPKLFFNISELKITSGFGFRRHPIKKRRCFHSGIDLFDKNRSTQIFAIGPGVVKVAKFARDYGNYVVIDHLNGSYTLYGHMKTLFVKAGERIETGDSIGIIGTTGMSTGVHCHLEFRVQSKTPNNKITVLRRNPMDKFIIKTKKSSKEEISRNKNYAIFIQNIYKELKSSMDKKSQ